LLTVLLLTLAAFVASIIDAIAGGGGLIVLPALLTVLPDPRLALGTNKGQSVFGAFTSLLSYYRAGRVDGRRALASFAAALVGSIIGVRLVLSLRPEILRPVVLSLLLFVVGFFALRGRRGRGPSKPVEGLRIAALYPAVTAAVIAFALGLYDGFFGPGTGTFLIVLFVTVFGDDLTQATANAKVANFASNVAAVVSFALAGVIDYRLALPMAGAQALGGVIGARAALRGGERLIRAAVLLVAAALSVRIAYQMLR
jgi:uncharacterized protein